MLTFKNYIIIYIIIFSVSNSVFCLHVDFQNSDIMVNINFSPSAPTACDQLNITCSATVPERLVHSPDSFIISYCIEGQQVVSEDNSDVEQFAIAREDNIFTRTVTINPVKKLDAREYFCVIRFSAPLSATSNNSSSVDSELTQTTTDNLNI